MTGLALPGLEAEVPPRSLRLPHPVWGLDVSTRRIALGAIVPDGDGPPRLDWGALTLEVLDKGPRRLHAATVGMRRFFSDAAAIARPRHVAVEQPYGGVRPHPQSYYMVAAVLVALQDALGTDVTITMVDPSSWKRNALGQGAGGAGKAQILAWATALGLDVECPKCAGMGKDCDSPCPAHDLADSLGIATHAGVVLAA